MSRPLRVLIERLRRSAVASSALVFAGSRQRQPALAGHADLISVLAVLAQDDAEGYPERDGLTRALLLEHRASGHACWSSALLVAFYPMLSRLRTRLVSDVVPHDELDHVVIAAFLSAMNALTPNELDNRVPMRLRQRTTRQVFSFLCKEWRLARTDDLYIAKVMAVGTVVESLSDSAEERRRELAAILERADDAGLSRGSLALLEATVLRQELLRDYVDRIAPKGTPEHERLYQRLKRQRSRALRRLRSLTMSPQPASDRL